MGKRIVIIDGNSLINRAYYAVQRPMITKGGLYTHGVYGFLNILNKMHKDYEPNYVVVTFDRKAPTFRHEAYAEYKAGRKKMPPELAMQLPLLKEVLEAMNIKILEIDGFEADDIIGTVAVRAEKEGLEPLIITGDKDELQLATDKTKVLITKKGLSDFEIYDYETMIEKYGFSPTQFIDYKGLMGDQSDNIPGIPGVGEKTAQKLILEFGDIDHLLENTENISNAKLRQKVEDYAQQALMSKALATINTNVPIEYTFEECKVEEPDYDKLIEVYRKLEFNSLLKKLSVPSTLSPSNLKPSPISPSSSALEKELSATSENRGEGKSPFADFQGDVTIIDNQEVLIGWEADMLNMCKGGKTPLYIKVFNDGNHRDIPVVNGIAVMVNKKVCYISTENNQLFNQVRKFLISNDFAFIGHNLIKDYYPLMAGITETEAFQFSTYFDTALAQYLLEPTKSNYLLKTLVLEYFHEDFMEEKDFVRDKGQMDLLSNQAASYGEYGAKWCLVVKALEEILTEKLSAEGLERVYKEVELPLIQAMSAMEAFGFAVDRDELVDAGEKIKERLAELTEQICQMAGESFNINSPSQLGVILFEKLDLPKGKKTKTGYSTDAEVLEKLRDKHEIIELILEYRMLSKLNGTYIEGLLPLIHHDGKIHAHFQQTITATGRLSCTEPNLQNIPIKQELGRKLRKAFIPESGEYVLVGADYSQIELRVLAHLSQDDSLLEAFNEGDDIHRITASKVFGVQEDQVTDLQRSNAKAVNFGVIYGMSGFGLSTELSISRKDAEKYIQEYFKKYTNVKFYMDQMVADCKTKGYVTTIMGRKRVIHEINAGNYMVRQLGERLAMNSPIQGSAADIIKLAMIKVYEELKRKKLRSRLILQVHDELIIETHREELEAVKKLLQENMEKAVELSVKLVAEVKTADNWYLLK